MLVLKKLQRKWFEAAPACYFAEVIAAELFRFQFGLEGPLQALPQGPVCYPHLGLLPVTPVLPCVVFRHFISHHILSI